MPLSTGTRPHLAVWACVIMWGFSGIFIKSATTPPLVASFYRLWFGVAILWIYAGANGRIRSLTNPTWLRLCLVGGALFGLHQIFFFAALESTRVANVNIISALQPALVAFLAARFFGEPIPWACLPFLAVALLGVAVVVVATTGLPGIEPYGNLLAILNLLAFTSYFLASKHARDHLGTIEYITGMTTIAALVLSVTLAANGTLPVLDSASDGVMLFGIALLPGTLGHVLLNWAHPHLPAFTISTTILAIPVISAIAADLLLDESITAAQVAGGTLVLAGVAMILRRQAAPAK